MKYPAKNGGKTSESEKKTAVPAHN